MPLIIYLLFFPLVLRISQNLLLSCYLGCCCSQLKSHTEPSLQTEPRELTVQADVHAPLETIQPADCLLEADPESYDPDYVNGAFAKTVESTALLTSPNDDSDVEITFVNEEV